MSRSRIQLRSSRLRGAFTLIELLVVIVIMAILAAVVLPTISNISGLQATSAARILAADLQYAQDTSITSQRSVTVEFNVSGESYTLSNASGALIHPMTKADYVVNYGSQGNFDKLDVVSASFGGNGSVTFDILGSPDSEGDVILQAGVHVYKVHVATGTGRVTVAALGS